MDNLREKIEDAYVEGFEAGYSNGKKKGCCMGILVLPTAFFLLSVITCSNKPINKLQANEVPKPTLVSKKAPTVQPQKQQNTRN